MPLNELSWSVIANLFTEFVVAVFGVLVAQRIARWWVERRFGGWHARIVCGETPVVTRRISAPKVKEILEEPAELSVFLKGLVSPYDMLHCDIIEQEEHPGLLTIDRAQKTFTVDLAHNPPGKAGQSPVVR